MKTKISAILLCILTLIFTFCGCSGKKNSSSDSNITAEYADVSEMDFSFTDRDKDSSYDESKATKIVFSEKSVSVSGNGTKASGTNVTLNSDATYIISGSCSDGSITVDAQDTDKIQLVLDNLKLESKDSSAVYIKNADKVFITLAQGSDNYVSDGSSYSTTDDGSMIDAAIFSKDDLTINGSGNLTVNGNLKHGIVSKDDLVVTGGNLTVMSKNTGLCGKDCLKIAKDANITVTAGSDGIKSDNSEDSSRGYIYIEGSTLNITSENDAIQAQTVLKIDGGNIEIKTGGGSSNSSSDSNGNKNPAWGFGAKNNGNSTADSSKSSSKGLKAVSDILISSGNFNIDSADDSVHSNNCIEISGGTFSISSGDDGIHADAALMVSGGDITVSKSYEGLESSEILISGGNISVTASDDGINAAGGNDSSSLGGRPGENSFSGSSSKITISGGYLYVSASGDGIDSNGSLYVTGGITAVNGPSSTGNGALDYDGTAKVTGGVLIALGSSGMAQGFTDAENQGAILYNFSTQNAGTTLAVCDKTGKAIVALKGIRNYSSVTVTAPEIDSSSTYSIMTGVSLSETDENGFSRNQPVSGGSSVAEVKMTSYLYSSSPASNAGSGRPQGGRNQINGNNGANMMGRPDKNSGDMPLPTE